MNFAELVLWLTIGMGAAVTLASVLMPLIYGISQLLADLFR